MEKHLQVRWKHHQLGLLSYLQQLQASEVFADVTLCCQNKRLKAHRILLSACSPYLQEILLENPSKHTTIILHDVRFQEMKALLDFMYTGAVDVPQKDFEMFLKAAEVLKVKGLSDIQVEKESTKGVSDIQIENESAKIPSEVQVEEEPIEVLKVKHLSGFKDNKEITKVLPEIQIENEPSETFKDKSLSETELEKEPLEILKVKNFQITEELKEREILKVKRVSENENDKEVSAMDCDIKNKRDSSPISEITSDVTNNKNSVSHRNNICVSINNNHHQFLNSKNQNDSFSITKVLSPTLSVKTPPVNSPEDSTKIFAKIDKLSQVYCKSPPVSLAKYSITEAPERKFNPSDNSNEFKSEMSVSSPTKCGQFSTIKAEINNNNKECFINTFGIPTSIPRDNNCLPSKTRCNQWPMDLPALLPIPLSPTEKPNFTHHHNSTNYHQQNSKQLPSPLISHPYSVNNYNGGFDNVNNRTIRRTHLLTFYEDVAQRTQQKFCRPPAPFIPSPWSHRYPSGPTPDPYSFWGGMHSLIPPGHNGCYTDVTQNAKFLQRLKESNSHFPLSTPLQPMDPIKEARSSATSRKDDQFETMEGKQHKIPQSDGPSKTSSANLNYSVSSIIGKRNSPGGNSPGGDVTYKPKERCIREFYMTHDRVTDNNINVNSKSKSELEVQSDPTVTIKTSVSPNVFSSSHSEQQDSPMSLCSRKTTSNASVVVDNCCTNYNLKIETDSNENYSDHQQHSLNVSKHDGSVVINPSTVSDVASGDNDKKDSFWKLESDNQNPEKENMKSERVSKCQENTLDLSIHSHDQVSATEENSNSSFVSFPYTKSSLEHKYQCLRTTQTPGSAQSYIKSHRCNECGKTFSRRQLLLQHHRIHTGEKPFRCEVCNKSFTQRGHWSIHQKLHDGEKPFSCTTCNKAFVSRASLKVHYRTHTGEKPFRCEDCGKQFSQLRNYKYHRSVHEGTREFSCTCPECGKYFNDRGYLSSHMKIHRNKKEYQCEYCEKSFNQRVAYNMHVRIHTGEKPHQCSQCGKSFSRKMLLKQHLRIHTGEKPFQCDVCKKAFADRSNMTLHMRLHTGEKPYSCTLCGKSFTKKHHLKTHMNFHTGVKPYKCEKCGLRFSQSSNMRTHYKKCTAAAGTASTSVEDKTSSTTTQSFNSPDLADEASNEISGTLDSLSSPVTTLSEPLTPNQTDESSGSSVVTV